MALRLKREFDPQSRALSYSHKPRVLISEGFSTYQTLEIQKFCNENNIKLGRIPARTSHKL